jgi:hypothetical protein
MPISFNWVLILSDVAKSFLAVASFLMSNNNVKINYLKVKKKKAKRKKRMDNNSCLLFLFAF